MSAATRSAKNGSRTGGEGNSPDDLTHYQKVVVVLKETIRLMTEIDRAIPGWPME